MKSCQPHKERKKRKEKEEGFGLSESFYGSWRAASARLMTDGTASSWQLASTLVGDERYLNWYRNIRIAGVSPSSIPTVPLHLATIHILVKYASRV